MTILTRTRVVLTRRAVFPEYVLFAKRDEDGSDTTHDVTFPAEAFRDMGEPEEVTVTIEPGNAIEAELLSEGRET